MHEEIIFNETSINAKFHHIGIACLNIDETFNKIKFLLPKKIKQSEIIYDQNMKCFLQLISINNSNYIELISGDIVQGYIKRNINIYHTCFIVRSIEEAIKDNNSFIPITKPVKAKLFDEKIVQFFHTPIGMIELLQST